MSRVALESDVHRAAIVAASETLAGKSLPQRGYIMRDSSALIPAEGIELTEAYAELVTKIEEAAILLPDFDEEDVELIEKSRIFED